MRIETTFLHSRVARRIFFLFVFCAVLPICILAAVTFYQVSSELQTNARLELQRASKAKGMAILERLGNLEQELRAGLQELDEGETKKSEELKPHFHGIETVTSKGGASVWFGTPMPIPTLTSEELEHVNSGSTLLTSVQSEDGGEVCLRMVRRRDVKHPEAGLVVAEIDSDYLWDPDTLPDSLQLAVFDGKRRPLYGTAASLPSVIGEKGPERSFEWALQGDRYDAAYWNLFLAQQFHSSGWTIVLSRKREDVAVLVQHFQSTFPLVALLAFWIVTLLSSIQIRRTLVPLEKLQEGTRLLGAQQFDTRVEVKSKDEFEDLASSFNAMAGQLGKQFEALKTINDIDKAILASLNRDGIVDAVLDRLPSLLGSDCCAIAVTKDDRFSSGASLSVISTRTETHKRVVGAQFAPEDLQRLQNKPNVLHLGPADKIPQFLEPLRRRDSISLSIFPAFGEERLVAAVICVHPGSRTIADLDVQHGRQIADQLAIAFSNVELMEAMEQLHWGTLTALARAIDAKSGWTAGHSERVTRLAMRIGRAMGLKERDLKIMHRGGLLHDIGKIGVPGGVLDKPGKLEPAEMNVMREHVRIGLRILEPIPGLSESLPIVAQHHEWFDGSGYPVGLSGE